MQNHPTELKQFRGPLAGMGESFSPHSLHPIMAALILDQITLTLETMFAISYVCLSYLMKQWNRIRQVIESRTLIKKYIFAERVFDSKATSKRRLQ